MSLAAAAAAVTAAVPLHLQQLLPPLPHLVMGCCWMECRNVGIVSITKQHNAAATAAAAPAAVAVVIAVTALYMPHYSLFSRC